MLLITGANGKLGRLIVDEVLRRAPDAPLAVSVRDASAASDLAERRRRRPSGRLQRPRLDPGGVRRRRPAAVDADAGARLPRRASPR